MRGLLQAIVSGKGAQQFGSERCVTGDGDDNRLAVGYESHFGSISKPYLRIVKQPH